MIKINFPESCHEYVRLQCNGAYDAYTNPKELPLMISLVNTYINKPPKVVLDLGSGIGRASVIYRNYFNWSDTRFVLADGHGGHKQVFGMHNTESHNTVYNSILAAEEFCLANNIKRSKFDQINIDLPFGYLMQFDFVISLCAVGFHWPVLPWLNRLESFVAKGGYLFLETRQPMRHQEWVFKQIHDVRRNSAFSFIDLQADKQSEFLILRRK